MFVSFANQQVNDYQSAIPTQSKGNHVYTNTAFVKSSEKLNYQPREPIKSGIINPRYNHEHNYGLKKTYRNFAYWDDHMTTKF